MQPKRPSHSVGIKSNQLSKKTHSIADFHKLVRGFFSFLLSHGKTSIYNRKWRDNVLIIKNYTMPKTIEEAYQLNQKASSRILGGCGWIKMSKNPIGTAIDLSMLGLNQIEEREDCFVIGAMVCLRELECHEGLNRMTQGAIRESLRHIVGVQFRNCATVGGSIFGRFGFSDVLTCFLALDTEVELYPSGRMPLVQFAYEAKNREILTHIIIKKENYQTVYLSHRNSATDFPVLACAVSQKDGKMVASIGARPMRAAIVEYEGYLVRDNTNEEEWIQFAEKVAETLPFGSNMRASAEYREYLTKVLVKRACSIMAQRRMKE